MPLSKKPFSLLVNNWDNRFSHTPHTGIDGNNLVRGPAYKVLSMYVVWRCYDGILFPCHWPKLGASVRLLLSDGSIVDFTGLN